MDYLCNLLLVGQTFLSANLPISDGRIKAFFMVYLQPISEEKPADRNVCPTDILANL